MDLSACLTFWTWTALECALTQGKQIVGLMPG
jgi:hypothetical protein